MVFTMNNDKIYKTANTDLDLPCGDLTQTVCTVDEYKVQYKAANTDLDRPSYDKTETVCTVNYT